MHQQTTIQNTGSEVRLTNESWMNKSEVKTKASKVCILEKSQDLTCRGLRAHKQGVPDKSCSRKRSRAFLTSPALANEAGRWGPVYM